MGWTDFIKPVLDIGGGLFDAYNQEEARDNYDQILHDREQANYDQSKATYDAYLAYQANKAANSGGGGSSGGSSAPRGTGRGGRIGNKFLRQQVKVGKKLLKPQAKTYRKALENMNMMSAYLNSPQSMALMNQSIPATDVNLGELPDYLFK